MSTQPGQVRIMTLWEPWATLAAIMLVKRHETRRWKTSYRGPLLIHAAAVWGKKQRQAWESLGIEIQQGTGHAMPAHPSLGMILCLTEITSCKPTEDQESPLFPDPAVPCDAIDRLCGDWSPGRYAMLLQNTRGLPEPIPWCGSQGRPRLAPPMLVNAVHDQLHRGRS